MGILAEYSFNKWIRGLLSKETAVLRRWSTEQSYLKRGGGGGGKIIAFFTFTLNLQCQIHQFEVDTS